MGVSNITKKNSFDNIEYFDYDFGSRIKNTGFDKDMISLFSSNANLLADTDNTNIFNEFNSFFTISQ